MNKNKQDKSEKPTGKSLVKIEDREHRNGHKGHVIWLTGLSGSGKSTIAYQLENELFKKDLMSFVLDGDLMRKGLSIGLGFDATGRKENLRRAAETAKMFREAGFLVICSFISPYREVRESIKLSLGPHNFMEIFVDCPLETCIKRDTKGLYEKARMGEIKDFTGISAPYEEPLTPELVLRTDILSVQECVDQIMERLIKRISLT